MALSVSPSASNIATTSWGTSCRRLFPPDLPFPLQPIPHQLSSDGLRPFQRKTQYPVPAKACQDSQCAADAKQYRIELIFHQPIMHEQSAAMRIYIRPWILDLSKGLQNR